jgi:putative FmdB family regulatory protein
MPMYNYVCECGHRVDGVLVLSFHDLTTPMHCETCGKEMKREIGLTSPPVFKGGGFHATDYKGKTQ